MTESIKIYFAADRKDETQPFKYFISDKEGMLESAFEMKDDWEVGEYVLQNPKMLDIFNNAANFDDPNAIAKPIYACFEEGMIFDDVVMSLYDNVEAAKAHFDYLQDPKCFPEEYCAGFIEQIKPSVERMKRDIEEHPELYHSINSDEVDGKKLEWVSLDSGSYCYAPVYVLR